MRKAAVKKKKKKMKGVRRRTGYRSMKPSGRVGVLFKSLKSWPKNGSG